MSYTIELPSIGPAFKDFEIKTWCVAVGDTIATGDLVCELFVLPDHRGSKMSWRERRGLKKSGVGGAEVERARVMIYSREPGSLVGIDAPAGTRVQPGDVLGSAANPAGGQGKFAVRAEVPKGKHDG